MCHTALLRLGRLALDHILPRDCVICGRPLLAASIETQAQRFSTEAEKCLVASALSSLCPSCVESLRPISDPRCERCGSSLISEQNLCMRCRGRDWTFDRAVPLFSYEGAFKTLLSAYKFGERRSLAVFFADLAERSLRSLWPGMPIVPVPPRPGKIREKGWDQVEAIVRILERRGLVVLRILERRFSAQQKRLGLVERKENARRAYGTIRGASVPRELVLLDDVITTCATAEACAAALRAAGARTISVLALAAD
jgi:ComF family protein